MFDLDYRLPTAVLAPTEGKAEAPGSSEKTASNVVDLALCGPIERGSADALCSTLRENAGANEIRLWVDSSGGNFAASFDLFVALHHHPAKKKVATIRRAESGALLAAMGCDRRIAEPHASLLIHPTRMMPEGAITAEKARELAATAAHVGERLGAYLKKLMEAA